MHSEFMLSKMTGRRLPLSFYLRRMQTFAMVRETLASPRATFSYKLFAIMTVLWMAYTMDLSDLQTHLDAINVLLESAEKGPHFKTREIEGPTLRPQWLLGMFLVSEFRIFAYHELCIARARFIGHLKQMEVWVIETQSKASQESGSVTLGIQGESLRELDTFLSEPLKAERLSTDLPFAVAAAPFFCCFSICATFVVRRMQLAEARKFLRCVQAKLARIDNGCSNGGTALSHMLGDARLETSVVSAQEELALEVSVCQWVINALKMYRLLSTATRIELTGLFYEVAMTRLHTPSVRSTTMRRLAVACDRDIENNWRRKTR